jgi:hypothetical protein
MDPRKLNIKQDRVNTLAKRTRPIVERNQHIPVVATLGAKVAPLADAYLATNEALKKQRVVSRAALEAGRTELSELHARARMWRGTVARELPGFERTEVSAPLGNPDGVLTSARLLVALVQEKGDEISIATLLTDDLTPRLERAEPAWLEAQAQLKRLQVLQGELRSIGARFLSELIALRAALRETLGPQDRDHRALRAHPRSDEVEVEEELDADEGGSIAAVQPAAASDPKPSGTTSAL